MPRTWLRFYNGLKIPAVDYNMRSSLHLIVICYAARIARFDSKSLISWERLCKENLLIVMQKICEKYSQEIRENRTDKKSARFMIGRVSRLSPFLQLNYSQLLVATLLLVTNQFYRFFPWSSPQLISIWSSHIPPPIMKLEH